MRLDNEKAAAAHAAEQQRIAQKTLARPRQLGTGSRVAKFSEPYDTASADALDHEARHAQAQQQAAALADAGAQAQQQATAERDRALALEQARAQEVDAALAVALPQAQQPQAQQPATQQAGGALFSAESLELGEHG
jgi:hypothetical protein